MTADITEERIEATILAIRERLSFNRSIEEQTVLALYAQRNEARSQLAALQSVPQGVEVPELDPGANPHQRNIDNPGSFGWILNRAYRDGYDEARKNARLVPTPPQAAPGAVDVVLDPPKSDRDCGDCTRLAICNGELACLCGPTSKMFDRKAPDYPLQPEERRVGPDEVVVDRNYLADLEESVIDTVEQLRVGFVLCENCGEQESTDTLDVMSMNLLPMIPRIEERRTSAQDHNGEGETAHCGTCAQSGHCVDAKWRVVCDDYLALQAPGQRGEG